MESWHYQQPPDLGQPLLDRLRRFPREPDMTMYGLRSMANLVIRSWLKLYHRLKIDGREHLPTSGSFVMVANHSSHLDALCLLAALPLRTLHRAFPAAAQDYFFVDLPRAALAAVFINALPFARQTRIRQSLDLCRVLLSNPGNILILFPEGTRSATGETGDFKPGIGLLVGGTPVPVLPCYLTGAHQAWPKGKWLPRPRTIHMRIGPARTYETRHNDLESARAISHDLRGAVLELSP